MILCKAAKLLRENKYCQIGKKPEITLRNTVFRWRISNIKDYQESTRKIHPVKPRDKKLLGSLREAIEKTGLKDGMTISFHHHFREGDFVINMVMDEIAKMGFKNLTIAPSSIANIHEPLIGHIKKGVVTNTHQVVCVTNPISELWTTLLHPSHAHYQISILRPSWPQVR